MDIKEYKELMMDYVAGKLNIEKKIEFEYFINAHSEYLKEIDDLKLVWESMDNTTSPEPRTEMDAQFYQFLKSETSIETTKRPSIVEHIISLFTNIVLNPNIRKLAYGIVILAIGVFIGNKLDSDTFKSVQNTEIQSAEIQKVRSQLVLALLEQPSANKRLQAVNEVNQLVEVEVIVINALFITLNNDVNTNVRLATVESLSNYVYLPSVREGLVQSIIKQNSPLVQIALADLMVGIDEKRSITPFRKLLKKEEINSAAKQKIEQSIQSLL